MRTLFSSALSALIASLVVLAAQPAHAQDVCAGDMAPTIAALQDCVSHALAIGHIDNAGIANSLLSKLDAAQRAQNRGENAVASSLLNAFMLEVEALAGKHIDDAHASHMVAHAEAVIAALGNQAAERLRTRMALG
jgi:hypothetical protein